MKKLIFTFSLIIISMVIFAQGQPANWSGAAGVTPSHSGTHQLANAITTIPSGTLLWSQGPGCVNVISSEVMNDLGVISNCADDFTFTSAENITSARWWFGWYQGSYATLSTWNITIYDNADCLPGNIVQQWTIPFSSSNEAFECNVSTFSYWANLSPAFNAAPNTKYWISIQAGDHTFPGQWGWDYTTTITGCEGAFKSEYFGFADYVPASELGVGSSVDFSFELYGGGLAQTPISNWALFIGIGLILVAAAIRFRRIL